MAFSKSAVKRFNDVTSCVPPPGAYDVKEWKKSAGPVSFEKTDRFKAPQDPHPAGSLTTDSLSTSTSSIASLGTPSKKLFNTSSLVGPGGNGKKQFGTLTPDDRNIKDLERELRRLLQQRGELDKKLLSMEQEMQKTEGKLQSALKDKVSLQAQVAAAEKEIKELQHSNDVLKKQISTTENHNKKHDNLIAELEAKEKEIAALQMRFECQVKTLQADLEESQSNITALQEQSAAHAQNEKDAVAHSEEVEREVTLLQGLADQLRSENSLLEQRCTDHEEQEMTLVTEMAALQLTSQVKITEIRETLEDKLKHALLRQEEIEQCLESCQAAVADRDSEATRLRQESSTLRQQVDSLQVRADQLSEESGDKDDQITELKKKLEIQREEIEAERKKLSEQKDETDSVREQLEICDRTMTENIKALSKKYQSMEDTLAAVETDYRKRVEKLNSKLHASTATARILEEECGSLRRSKLDQMEQLNSEKEKKETLLREMKKLQEKSSAEISQLKQQLQEACCNLENSHRTREVQQERIGELEAINGNHEHQLFCLQNELKCKQERVTKLFDLSEDLSSKLKHGEAASSKLTDMADEFNRYKQTTTEEIENLKRKLTEAEKTAKDVEDRAKVDEEDLKKQLEIVDEKSKREKEEFGRRLVETQKKLTNKETEFQKYKGDAETKLRDALEELQRQQKEFQDTVCELQHKVSQQDESATEAIKEEVLSWKTRYEDLQEKVQPFTEQLDAFEAEKKLLLSKNNMAQNEVQKLSTQYAKLLGHKNQKQKIQHILKLKEENLSMKQEVMKLREQETKQRSQIRKLEDKVDKLEGKKKFNAAMAFKHVKENATPFADQNQS